LPNRKLDVRDAEILIDAPEIPASEKGPAGNYKSSELSDGERSIFYLLGQCLLAPKDALIIVDEPELHIHRAILGKLWDSIEAQRSDCGFLYCTHDLDFAVKRSAADKYFVRRIQANSRWQLEAMPEGTGIPEDVLAEIAGSRQPILFVEGDKDSLDIAIYASIYPHLKVQPMGGCDVVVHSVASFKNNPALHQYGPVYGCIDADHRPAKEIVALQTRQVFSLPVAEIENVYLLPSVFQALAEALAFAPDVVKQKMVSLRIEVFKQARADVDAVAARYASRQIDRALKQVTLSRRESDKLVADFVAAIPKIKPQEIVEQCKSELEDAIATDNLEQVLALYDNKHLITIAAKLLEFPDGKKLSAYASRLLASKNGENLREAISRRLPKIG
jgi:hypothetical protein